MTTDIHPNAAIYARRLRKAARLIDAPGAWVQNSPGNLRNTFCAWSAVMKAGIDVTQNHTSRRLGSDMPMRHSPGREYVGLIRLNDNYASNSDEMVLYMLLYADAIEAGDISHNDTAP